MTLVTSNNVKVFTEQCMGGNIQSKQQTSDPVS